jgi:hypothetical protein
MDFAGHAKFNLFPWHGKSEGVSYTHRSCWPNFHGMVSDCDEPSTSFLMRKTMTRATTFVLNLANTSVVFGDKMMLTLMFDTSIYIADGSFKLQQICTFMLVNPNISSFKFTAHDMRYVMCVLKELQIFTLETWNVNLTKDEKRYIYIFSSTYILRFFFHINIH